MFEATLKADPSSNKSYIEIYRRLRPGDLATLTLLEILLTICFFV